MKKYFTLLFVFILFSANVFAQQTGRFDATVTFMGEQRMLSFFVPQDYNAEESYKLMVCLHGLGDTGQNFANALFTYWSELDGNMIFVAPDGGEDVNSDFYAPGGDEEIVQVTIDYALENYNIDENEIILEGFSLGGRSAFKYGLDNPDKFKGLLLNTPAFQGIKDVMGIIPHSLGYNLDNAKNIPIVLCHGEQDFAYLNPVRLMYEKLIVNDGIAVRALIPTMGHSIPPNNITSAFLAFIDSPYQDEDNCIIDQLINPQITNDQVFRPTVRFRGVGTSNVTNVVFNVESADGSEEYTWDGNLSAYEHIDLELNEITLKHGENNFTVSIVSVNGTTEGIFTNKYEEGSIYYQASAFDLPLTQGFEDDNETDQFWTEESSGNWFYWMGDDEVKKSGMMSIFMLNTPFFFDNQGIAESFISPFINLSSVDNPILSFDIAHSYLHFGPPMISEDLDFVDTLDILISVDGGLTYQSVIRHNGIELLSSDQPITNAQSLEQCIFYPREDEWKTIQVDLKEYKDVENAQFKFKLISGLGGSTNIDNILFKDASTDVEFDEEGIAVYPIPAREELNVVTEESIESADLYNMLGVKVPVTIQQGNNLKLNLEGVPAGAYMLEMRSGGSTVKKMIIKE